MSEDVKEPPFVVRILSYMTLLFLNALIIYFIWNITIPEIFVGAPKIEYLHAVGLNLLVRSFLMPDKP